MTQFWLGSGASRYPGSICSCVAGAGKDRLARMLGMTSIRSIGSADVASIRCVPRLITCGQHTQTRDQGDDRDHQQRVIGARQASSYSGMLNLLPCCAIALPGLTAV